MFFFFQFSRPLKGTNHINLSKLEDKKHIRKLQTNFGDNLCISSVAGVYRFFF
jgi:hypothetical protein